MGRYGLTLVRTLVGIDIGTSATRAVLIGEDGRPIGTARRQHSVSEPRPGHAEHDAEAVWWGETCEVLAEIAARFPDATARLGAIGLSAVGASMVPIDEMGRAMRPAILYGIDRRATVQMDHLERSIGHARVRERTGRDFTTQSVGPKILWIKEHEPEIAARTHQYLPPTAFLARRLGAEAVIDPHTALAVHPLFRADRMTWDEEALQLVCRQEQLPTVKPAGTPIGVLDGRIARKLGLPEGIPIGCGTADVLADSVASGAVRPGDTMVMYGSTLFIVHVTERFEPRPPFWASVYPIGGHRCLVTGTSTAGAAAEWFLGVAGCEGIRNRDGMLEAAGKISAAADGLVFLPYLRGERAPIFEPSARGVFFGLTTQHSQVHLYRAVLEGIGFSLRHVLEEMRLAPERVLVSGGGSDLALPLQLAADASGLRQLKARRGRSAGFGAAVLAGLGAGIIDESALDDDFFGGFEIIEPRRADGAEAAYTVYRKVSQLSRSLFREPPYQQARNE